MTEENTLPTSTVSPLAEISHAPPALEAFLDKHQMKLIVLAIVLTILAATYVVVKGLKESAEQTAGNLLVSSDDISDLQSITKNHKGTAAAFSAKILLAEKQWEDGQQDDAIATLRAFVDADRSHPGRASAQASLGAKLRIQGKADEAEEIFRDLTEDSDALFLAPYAWISLGDIELENGNTEEARKAYESVERDFPGSSYVQEATNRRLLLGAVSPVEVSAPISVPDVSFTDDVDDLNEIEGSIDSIEAKDLLDAVQDLPANNPLIPDDNPTQPSE